MSLGKPRVLLFFSNANKALMAWSAMCCFADLKEPLFER